MTNAEAGRVLIVDDDPDDGELAVRRLGPLQAHVEFHVGPEGAIDRIRSEPYDVVVLDLNMPGISGLQILKALEQLGSKVRVLLYSAMDPDSLAEIARTAGVAHVNKSASRSEFVRRVRELITGELILDAPTES